MLVDFTQIFGVLGGVLTLEVKKVDFKSSKTYVIAEIGMTHDGSFGLATQLTQSAIDSGVDIVKYQWHIAEAETLKDAPAPSYFTNESRFEYFTRTEFSVEEFKGLVQQCHEHGVLACISVFSLESVDRVVESGADIIKIPSGEISNVPLLRKVAATGLPVVMSSGMSDWQEIDRAVEIFKPLDQFCLVQCSSIYPCPPENAGLNLITEMQKRYDIPVGLSDHTLTSATAVAAVVLGAKIVEKHFTISKALYGPDARFSLEPHEFKQMCEDIEYVNRAMQSQINKDDIAQYDKMREVFTKSILVKGEVKKGDVISIDNLSFKKPGTGISAAEIDSVLGKKVLKDLGHDEFLRWEDLEA